MGLPAALVDVRVHPWFDPPLLDVQGVKNKAIPANTRLATEILAEFSTWSGITSQKK